MQLNELSGIAITFVVLAVILGIGSTILNSVGSGQTCVATSDATWNESAGMCMNSTGHIGYDSFSTNSTRGGLLGLREMASWQDTLAIIVVAAVVIGAIGYFYTRRN